MSTFTAPPGWCVLRCAGRLEARWSADDGRWARYSVRLAAGSARPPAGTLLFSHPVGGGHHLVVAFDSSDLGVRTVAAASELLTPLQRMMARAVS
jgi:hypothetical protein